MVLHNLLAQSFSVDMCVDFGCGNAFMPKHGLYYTQIGTPFEQMGCKGMSEGMRADIFIYLCRCHQFFYYAKDCYSRQWFATSFAHKNIVLIAGLYINAFPVVEIVV